MSWLDNYVRPRIQQLVRRAPAPADLWRQCPACAQMIFHKDLDAARMVCPNCGHHMRIGAEARFDLLLDEGSRVDLELPETPLDPLKFRDRKRYTDRLKEAGQKNGPGDALKAAVIDFQHQYGLEADGLVGKRTLAALNVPVSARIDQLRVNLERVRWVFRDLEPEPLIETTRRLETGHRSRLKAEARVGTRGGLRQ